MKVWVLASLFSVAAVSWASAAEVEPACGLEDQREIAQSANVERVLPVLNVRETRKAQVVPVAIPTATPMNLAPPAEMAEARTARPADRRRAPATIRRVPDAVLIDGRGVL